MFDTFLYSINDITGFTKLNKMDKLSVKCCHWWIQNFKIPEFTTLKGVFAKKLRGYKLITN